MAMSMLPVVPVGVRATVSTSHRKPEVIGQKTSSSKWWAPIFGWSTEPDYIDTENNNKISADENLSSAKNVKIRSDSDRDPKITVPSRFAPGSFTEEKARQLRMMTTEATTFHDVMYHSAIASRLASDFANRSDG